MGVFRAAEYPDPENHVKIEKLMKKNTKKSGWEFSAVGVPTPIADVIGGIGRLTPASSTRKRELRGTEQSRYEPQ